RSPAGTRRPCTVTSAVTRSADGVLQLRQQLERERRARLEADAVAQKALRDLVEKKQELAASEVNFRSLLEAAHIGIYRSTPGGAVLLANGTLLRMLGLSADAGLGSLNLEAAGLVVDPPRALFRERLEREGKLTGFESTWRRRDGSSVCVRENVRLVRGADGSVAHYEGTVEDITAQKQAEARVQLQVQRPQAPRTIDLATSSRQDPPVHFPVPAHPATSPL